MPYALTTRWFCVAHVCVSSFLMECTPFSSMGLCQGMAVSVPLSYMTGSERV